MLPLFPTSDSALCPDFFCSASFIRSWKFTGAFGSPEPLATVEDVVVGFDDVAVLDDDVTPGGFEEGVLDPLVEPEDLETDSVLGVLEVEVTAGDFEDEVWVEDILVFPFTVCEDSSGFLLELPPLVCLTEVVARGCGLPLLGVVLFVPQSPEEAADDLAAAFSYSGGI